jgi:hypothetical protein
VIPHRAYLGTDPTFITMAVLDASPAFQFLVSRRIPPELVLKTIQHLPFEDGKRIASLSLIPRLKHLISTYEHSITSWFMKKELRHALVDFPYGEKFGLKWLADCVSRYDVVDAVMDELTWRENCVAVEPHNVAAVNGGLLLLYRLASIGKFYLLTSCQLLHIKFNPNLTHFCSKKLTKYPRLAHLQTQFPHITSPLASNSLVPCPSSRYSNCTLPRPRLDPSAHLWPLHGRQPTLSTQRTRV